MSCNENCDQGRTCDCCPEHVPEGFMLAVVTVVGVPLIIDVTYLVLYKL